VESAGWRRWTGGGGIVVGKEGDKVKRGGGRRLEPDGVRRTMIRDRTAVRDRGRNRARREADRQGGDAVTLKNRGCRESEPAF
jgi:hypothetical protein